MMRVCLFTWLALPVTAAAAASASAQSVAIDQAGNANAAIVTQNDPDTRLLASMMGDGNDLRVRQTGADADLTALSDGTGNMPDALQAGVPGGANVAIVSQSGVATTDRTSVVEGTSVVGRLSLGGRRISKKKYRQIKYQD